MKRWLSLVVTVLALASMPILASAGDSEHFGPFNSASPDSGTCGNNWANDTFKRKFDASTTPNADGTYTVTETFRDGDFVTVAGPSPDACDPTGIKGSTIRAGVSGSFQGNFLVVVSSGTFNPNAECTESTCNTTAGFVATVYGGSATFSVTSFGFTYHAHGSDLIQREWRNASADQGGNGGDIRSS